MNSRTPILAALAVALVLSVGPAPALACFDNSDGFIDRLVALDLKKDQIEKVFALKENQKKLVADCHKDGKSCTIHEQSAKDFEAAAVGYLDDAQFEKYTGRKRTEIETLKRENQLLKDELADLKKQVEEMKKAGAAKPAAEPAAGAPAEATPAAEPAKAGDAGKTPAPKAEEKSAEPAAK